MITKKILYKLWSVLRKTKFGKGLTGNPVTRGMLTTLYNACTPTNRVIYDAKNYKISIDPRDIGIGRRYIIDGEHEPLAKEYVATLDFQTFIEVGANIGDWPLYLAARNQKIDFHLLEPVPEICQILRYNLKLNKIQNANVYELAASDSCGMAVIHLDQENRGNNSLNKTMIDKEAGKVHIITKTLDDLFGSIEFTGAFLKLDAQGHELEILRGATATLNKIDYLMLETTAEEWTTLVNSNFFMSRKINKVFLINELNDECKEISRIDNVSKELAINNYYDLVIHFEKK